MPAQESSSSMPAQVKNVASATDDSDYFNVDIRVLNEFNQQKGLPYNYSLSDIYILNLTLLINLR